MAPSQDMFAGIHEFLAQTQYAKRNPPPNLGPWLNDDNEDSAAYPRHRLSISYPPPRISPSMASSSTARTQLTSIFDSSDSPASAGTGSFQYHQHYQRRPQRNDRGGSTSSASFSVPDPHELDGNGLLAIHEQAEIPAQNFPPTMPCEFSRYTGCTHVFCPFRQWKQWIRHEIEVHLKDKLPATCVCWFCDDFKFDAATQTEDDRRLNFDNRMQHIAGHFREGEAGHIRPDFHFLEHLWSNGMITQAVFDREKNVHEALQIDGLRPPNSKTSKMLREEEQRSRVIVQDDPRQERERRRRREQSRRQKDKV